jgi:hypothetical protein
MISKQQNTIQSLDPHTIYETIRQEILDQKKCQFQLFSITVTVTAGILAYTAGIISIPPIYLVPLFMNDLSLLIILDKAISIQRKVGYLQIMEQKLSEYHWMWEAQLDIFRKKVPLRSSTQKDPSRKHTYITTVGLLLILLNMLCVFLYILGPEAIKWHLTQPQYVTFISNIIGILAFAAGFIILFLKRYQLINGRHSGPSIKNTWEDVLKEYKK